LICSPDLWIDRYAHPPGPWIRHTQQNWFAATEASTSSAHRREVIYSVSAENMEEALQKFQSSPHSAIEILFVIKTETEIYLHQGK
jgi:hypothetical protein